MPNFDLQDLYAFLALSEHGSFRYAAEAICISQSALSRRIEKLETLLGVRLFDRTTRRVTLTQTGRTFAPRARHLLLEFEEAIEGIGDGIANSSRLITVACVPSAANYFMPQVISHFRMQFPEARIRVIDTSAGEVASAVQNRKADFGLSFLSSIDVGLVFTPLVDETYQAVCRRDDPRAQRTGLTWEEFFAGDYIWLDKSSGNRLLLDQALGKVTARRQPVCETLHVTAMLGMVDAGLGLAAAPAMAVPGYTHAVLTTLPLTNPTVKRQVGLIKKAGRELSPQAALLEAAITSYFLTRV
ncbi:LysR family transcriptional regulator [Enterobacteriaceae bacterium H16N7]|nr:LysR family transcriptional regulator [Dryocola clanedunensis]